MPDAELAKLLMNLCVRGRVDLSIKLLEYFSLRGRMQVEASAAASPFSWEQPENVSWDELVSWSGAKLDLPTVEFLERQKEGKVLDEYQPYDYVSCFESAFENQFESISFDTMDFTDVRACLKRLDEYLDAYFDQVVYPPAATAEVIPHIVGDHQWTDPQGVGYIQFLYTPVGRQNHSHRGQSGFCEACTRFFQLQSWPRASRREDVASWSGEFNNRRTL